MISRARVHAGTRKGAADQGPLFIRPPFWTLDEEIFENERTLATVQGGTAGQARYFAIHRRPARGFHPHDLILCGAVRTLKP
jgi:hypothetical protein